MGLNGPEDPSQAISPAIMCTPLPSCLYSLPGMKDEKLSDLRADCGGD